MHDVCRAVVAWQRPMHLHAMPTRYRAEHHPLDIARLVIGWLGWVPFPLTPHDVPEARIVAAQDGGTNLASYDRYWQASGPDADPQAIAQAQALDLRLNTLGVLPTSLELERGDWGQ